MLGRSLGSRKSSVISPGQVRPTFFEMEDSGRDVLWHYETSFTTGMHDLSTSSPAADNLLARYDYSAPGGLFELREAISGLYPGLNAENVIVTNGASEALAACAFALINPGDRVVVAPGSYPSFERMAMRVGARLESGESPSGASVLLVNNPRVPSGSLVEMAEILERAGDRTAVIADEVYLRLGKQASAPTAVSLCRRAVSIGDLSKPLGLGGLRIGWVASRDAKAIARISRAVQLLSGGPSLPAMELALAAVHQYEQKIDTRTKFAASNGKLLFDLFRRRGWKLIEPEAGWTFLAYPPSAPPLGFQEDLANARLFVVPGEAFGQPGGFRFSVFAAPDKVQRAIQIISPVPADASPVVSETLLILAKSPLESKSRISAALGAPATRALAEAFLKDTFELAGQTGRRLDVAFTPAEAESCFRELAPTAKFSAQPEAEFGQRIHAALTRSLAGARNVVLIGTDTPHLPAAFIEQAFDALEESDLVLGPSTDGGFYLIGVKHCPAELFRNVEWSTSTVFETVESNARCLGLRMSTLDPWTDIDDLESLRSEAARIGATASAPHTREALQVLGIEASHVA